MHQSDGNAIHRRVLIALLGLIILGFFIATLANRVPSPIVFGDNTSATSTLWAWGDNLEGQLGNGTTNFQIGHTQESTGATNWSAVAAGNYHTVALKSDGTLWAWGNIGYCPNFYEITPAQESTGATNWSAIAAGENETVALKSDGTLWACGRNHNGEVGDGTKDEKLIFTQESTGATNWSAIAMGRHHTVALKSDGTLWAWGENYRGQLGDGTNDDKTIPTQESTGATTWSAIAGGGNHTASLRSDDTLWTWGYNHYGQLGDGTATIFWVPGKVTPTCSCVFYWTATFDLASGDTEGAVAFTINFADTAGNPGTQVTSTTDGTSVTLDKTAPTLLSVAIDSGNATSVAKVGDTVTLSFTADEPIQAPTVAFSVGGASATGLVTVTNVSGNEWTAAFTLASGDTEGAVAFTINFADTAGNPGTQVTSTTDGTSVVATTVPSSPTNVSAIPGNLLATVSWTAPVSDGGSPITEYTVISSLGGITATTTATSLTVTGLTNGTAYTFIVTATNSNGTSLSSDASNSVTPALVPGAPTDVSATPVDVLAVVSWTAPASDGGNPITGYTVTSDPGGVTATTASTSVTVTGLTQNTAYTFTVTATNAAGTSASSEASPSVTTLLTNIWDAPSTSGWGLAALVTGMLVVMVIALGLTSGSRRAARP